MEAARSIGFGPVRSMMMIVVPQAVKNILPNFGNEFANLIKASSQVMVRMENVLVVFFLPGIPEEGQT